MNAKLEILYLHFPSGADGPYVLLKRWSLVGDGEVNPVSDIIMEWGLSSNGLLAERHLLCLDAYLPDDELIAMAKAKLPDNR